MQNYNKILIIQTAFIGDVILATALIESLHNKFSAASIDFCLRKGNEGILDQHPKVNQIFIWDKKESKNKNLLGILKKIKKNNYDLVITPQRFFSAGLLTAFSGAKVKVGFKKNPLSIFFTKSFEHEIGNGTHEIERNHELISFIEGIKPSKPKLFPPTEIPVELVSNYITISPSSVWFTKAFPVEQWIKLCDALPNHVVYIIGGPGDKDLAEKIISSSSNKNLISLCGKLSLLESAAVLKNSTMNYVNDSAPLHLCSATNAPVCAIFCSTTPKFGFTPTSDVSYIVEVEEKLPCKPCGLHGKRECPLKHFKCGFDININQLTKILPENKIN